MKTTYLTRFFSNYMFTSKQREIINWQFLFVSMLYVYILCIHADLKSRWKTKIKIKSRLHFIHIHGCKSHHFLELSTQLSYNITIYTPKMFLNAGRKATLIYKNYRLFFSLANNVFFSSKNAMRHRMNLSFLFCEGINCLQ